MRFEHSGRRVVSPGHTVHDSVVGHAASTIAAHDVRSFALQHRDVLIYALLGVALACIVVAAVRVTREYWTLSRRVAEPAPLRISRKERRKY